MGACGSSDDTDDTTPDKEETITVTFDLNYTGATDTPPVAQTIKKGDKAKVPTEPTRAKYKLTNWYIDKATTKVFAFTKTITADTKLYAGWQKIITYTVTFDLNGGTGTAPTPVTVEHGKTTTKPAAPTRDGYTFDNWYTDAATTKVFTFTTPITADITLYAGWWLYPYSITLGGTEYAGIADDTTKTILVDIGTVYKKINGQTVGLVVTDSAGKTVANQSVKLTNAKANIIVTRDGNTYTVLKLFVKPTTKDDLIAIINAAITAEGDTANLNFIDTSLMTDMSQLFISKTAFNGNLSEWDTANVTTMQQMFYLAQAFNQAIGNWDTAKVTNMSAMFSDAQAFNQTIGNWDTAKVTNMSAMFSFAVTFNQDISGWKTGKVTTMYQMFLNASAFNQAISNWKTGEVTTMNQMFTGATKFDQNLSGWDVGKVTNHTGIFLASAMENKTTQHPKFK